MTDSSRPGLGKPRRVGGDGEIEVFCADEQTVVPVDLDRWQQLATHVLVAEGVRGFAELSLLFIGEADMAELNEQHMGKQGPTDVLAFPIDAGDYEVEPSPYRGGTGPDRSPVDLGDMPLLLGDVVVCPAVAQRQCSEHAGTLDDELALLVVHGLLHVLGHDHDEPENTAVMRARELEHLVAFHWHGPAPEGFRQEHAE